MPYEYFINAPGICFLTGVFIILAIYAGILLCFGCYFHIYVASIIKMSFIWF